MMTSSVPDVFQSHHEVMDALDQNYAGSADAQRASTINKLHQDIATACQRQEEEAKIALLGMFVRTKQNVFKSKNLLLCADLSQQVSETQEEATPKAAPEAHPERVHSLLQLTQDAKENVYTLNEATR